ncbi:MAG: hypothetical protein K0S08_2191 [Gammaproteobacteria bacterium]|jgi:uncharacterized protein YjeT (DUF2065 family)|nr:hypothetical protein [Gammaproteobacteria bacterium]
MLWKIIFNAIALMLVLEGLWPFINARAYKRFLLMMLTQSEKQLQIVGLVLMLIGLVITIIVHSFA